MGISENDAVWVETYQPQMAKAENIKIHQRDLEFFTYDKTECRKYKNLQEVIHNHQYNLIIVDGPWGAEQSLPRSNVLDVIKNPYDYSNINEEYSKTPKPTGCAYKTYCGT